jgi:hypothetical protein
LDSSPDLETTDLIELNLSRLNETYIRDRLMHSNLFDILNNEKMTPHFLKLASVSKNVGTLAEIKNEEGENFSTDSARQKHILDEYKKIYGKEGAPCTVENIREFLGLDICQNVTVLNKKLPEDLKLEMEQDLSLLELDSAMASAKLTSAGGMDGINNRALKKFWAYLRMPLYKYAKLISVNEKVTDSFNSASITVN